MNYIVVRSTVRLHSEGEKVKQSLNQLIYTYPLAAERENQSYSFLGTWKKVKITFLLQGLSQSRD